MKTFTQKWWENQNSHTHQLLAPFVDFPEVISQQCTTCKKTLNSITATFVEAEQRGTECNCKPTEDIEF